MLFVFCRVEPLIQYLSEVFSVEPCCGSFLGKLCCYNFSHLRRLKGSRARFSCRNGKGILFHITLNEGVLNLWAFIMQASTSRQQHLETWDCSEHPSIWLAGSEVPVLWIWFPKVFAHVSLCVPIGKTKRAHTWLIRAVSFSHYASIFQGFLCES